MKTPDKKIFNMLHAYEKADVLKAIELYQAGIEDENAAAKQELTENGWQPQENKPENREFYFFDNQYWVQTDEARKADIEKQKKKLEAQQAKNIKTKKYTGQKMDLSLTSIGCPKCQSKMYKQSVCPRCKEGRKGFKIRLICEENPNHEVLL